MPRGGPRINSGGAREGAGRPADSGWKTTTTEWRASAAAHANELVGSDRDPLLFLIDRVFDDAVEPRHPTVLFWWVIAKVYQMVMTRSAMGCPFRDTPFSRITKQMLRQECQEIVAMQLGVEK